MLKRAEAVVRTVARIRKQLASANSFPSLCSRWILRFPRRRKEESAGSGNHGTRLMDAAPHGSGPSLCGSAQESVLVLVGADAKLQLVNYRGASERGNELLASTVLGTEGAQDEATSRATSCAVARIFQTIVFVNPLGPRDSRESLRGDLTLDDDGRQDGCEERETTRETSQPRLSPETPRLPATIQFPLSYSRRAFAFPFCCPPPRPLGTPFLLELTPTLGKGIFCLTPERGPPPPTSSAVFQFQLGSGSWLVLQVHSAVPGHHYFYYDFE